MLETNINDSRKSTGEGFAFCATVKLFFFDFIMLSLTFLCFDLEDFFLLFCGIIVFPIVAGYYECVDLCSVTFLLCHSLDNADVSLCRDMSVSADFCVLCGLSHVS